MDLLGRDTLLLSRILAALGSFAECVSRSSAALPLGAAVLGLLRAPSVHGHCEPAVRRAALLAAGQVRALFGALPRVCVQEPT